MKNAIEALLVAQRIQDAENQLRSDRSLLRVLIQGDYDLAGVSQWGVLTHFLDQSRITPDGSTSIKVDRVARHGDLLFYYQEAPNVPKVVIIYSEVTETILDSPWPG